MNQFAMRLSLFAVVGGFVVLAGCSSKESRSEAPAATSVPAPHTAAPSDEAGTAGAIVPAATVGELWGQIETEQGRLSSAIQNGQLNEVHLLAFGIRDLAVVLAEKANAASPGTARQVNGMVDQVKACATKLDELGDAGNLSGTQMEAARLDKTLVALKSVTVLP